MDFDTYANWILTTLKRSDTPMTLQRLYELCSKRTYPGRSLQRWLKAQPGVVSSSVFFRWQPNEDTIACESKE